MNFNSSAYQKVNINFIGLVIVNKTVMSSELNVLVK